jgi:hypothetical protein
MTQPGQRPSQPPFHFAQAITKLCQRGKLEEAIQMTKDAPLSSQNEVVWNQLIKEALKDGRLKLSYELFIDVSSVISFGGNHSAQRLLLTGT